MIGQAVPAPTAPTRDDPADSDVCPVCQGAGWVRFEVPVGHPMFGRAVRCECLSTMLESQRFEDLERLSALEPFRDRTFENFDPKVHGVGDAFEIARRFARDPYGWLVLRGGYGSGKTHLAAAIANEALNARAQVLFAVVPDLLDHLRSSCAPNSAVQYDELFEGVRTTHLLVLDDLGTESATPWAQEKLYQIINYRYNYQMPTVVTTNRRLEQIDDRIQSRLRDQ
ncbi:MAG TPA: ATP-binding protein, partial [Chloroflexota bacterium]|nr:ATP-binding protein [Chloroflexota bacterium]